MRFEAMKDDFLRIDRMMRENAIFTERRFAKEYYTGYSYETLYDWDQYFETLVQLYLGWKTKYARNGVEIFLDYQKENGHIQRSSTGCDAQLSEHVKPFLAQICLLIYKRDRTLDFLTEDYYRRMKKYLLYWLDERDVRGAGLSVWDSAPHSGMDNQHERAGWWHAGFCEGVDLNAFLVRECGAFALIAEMKNQREDAAYFRSRREKIMKAMQKLMWNEEAGLFFDIDARTGRQIPVKHIGIFAVLWAGIATKEQARRLVYEHLMNPDEFFRRFPFPALSADEPGYSERMRADDLGCSWRAQTWIPTNYYVFEGLRAYGYRDLADFTAWKTASEVKRIGDREYYNTESVSGNGLNPFWGWSLLAYFMPVESETGLDPTRLDEESLKEDIYRVFEE